MEEEEKKVKKRRTNSFFFFCALLPTLQQRQMSPSLPLSSAEPLGYYSPDQSAAHGFFFFFRGAPRRPNKVGHCLRTAQDIIMCGPAVRHIVSAAIGTLHVTGCFREPLWRRAEYVLTKCHHMFGSACAVCWSGNAFCFPVQTGGERKEGCISLLLSLPIFFFVPSRAFLHKKTRFNNYCFTDS